VAAARGILLSMDSILIITAIIWLTCTVIAIIARRNLAKGLHRNRR
jgi:hypothetical protein